MKGRVPGEIDRNWLHELLNEVPLQLRVRDRRTETDDGIQLLILRSGQIM